MTFMNSFTMKKLNSGGKFLLTSVLFCISTLFSFAQENRLPETNGAFHAISVQNIDNAIEWYTKHLDFKVESKVENDQRKGALLSRSGTMLELAEFSASIHRNDIKPNIESHELYGIFKMGFTTKNLDGAFTFFEDSEVEVFFPIVTATDGTRTFGIKDMEGNIIQFFGK